MPHANFEFDRLPSEAVLTQMHAYNTSLVDSGALLTEEVLTASANGARVVFSPTTAHRIRRPPKDQIQVTPGPFASDGAHRVVCGYGVIKARDLEDAIEWAEKAPLGDTDVEIRKIHELEDSGTRSRNR